MHGRLYNWGLVDRKLVEAPPPPTTSPVILLLAVPRRLFYFGSLVVLDVVFRYLSLFLLYINIKIGKNRCLMLDWPVATFMGNFPTRCLGWDLADLSQFLRDFLPTLTSKYWLGVWSLVHWRLYKSYSSLTSKHKTWSQTFGAWKVVKLPDISLVSKPWR